MDGFYPIGYPQEKGGKHADSAEILTTVPAAMTARAGSEVTIVRSARCGLWRQNFDRHAYRGLRMEDVSITTSLLPRGVQPGKRIFPSRSTQSTTCRL